MIYFITKLEAQTLLTPDEYGRYHGPRPGMEFDWYLVFDDPGWTAIDNSSGDAWTEDFETIEEAIRWLESDRSKEELEEEAEEPANSDGDGEIYNLKYDYETEFDQDRLLHLHGSDVELTELITDAYEKETGRSCVNWYSRRRPRHRVSDDLPRDPDYSTQGYSDGFWKWMGKIEDMAIESGVETVGEMAAFFLGRLMPGQAG